MDDIWHRIADACPRACFARGLVGSWARPIRRRVKHCRETLFKIWPQPGPVLQFERRNSLNRDVCGVVTLHRVVVLAAVLVAVVAAVRAPPAVRYRWVGCGVVDCAGSARRGWSTRIVDRPSRS